MNILIRIILYTFVICPMLKANSQGITFSQPSSIEDAFKKASDENRFLFIDVYATWCGPCKVMDQKVYPLGYIGKFFNEKFLSIKVQMDTNKKDSDYTRSWYSEAKELKDKYKISSLPSFLIFNPHGQLVFRTSGAKSSSTFLEMAKIAIDPIRNYEGQTKKFQARTMTDSELLQFVKISEKVQDDSLAKASAIYYKSNYLDKLPEVDMLRLENLQFVLSHSTMLLNTSDKWFKLLNDNRAKIGNLVGKPNISLEYASTLVSREENPMLRRDNGKDQIAEPDWQKLFRTISSKYDHELAAMTVANDKLIYYKRKKDWPKYIDAKIAKIDAYGFNAKDGWAIMDVNNFIYSIVLKNSVNRKQLLKAKAYMEKILEANPKDGNNRDTYAYVLYKLGKKKEAIKQEELALNDFKESFKTHNKEPKSDQLKPYLDAIENMKNGTVKF